MGHSDPIEEAALLDAIGRWLEKEVRPQVMRLEHDDIYPRAMVETMKQMGLFGAVLDPQWGGLGLSASTYAKIVMQISTVWMSLTGIFNSHLMMAMLVQKFGSEEQKKRFLPRMASGEMVAAIAMTEPGAGSDVAGIKSTVKLHGTHWEISGRKTFITNGEIADLYLVFARTSPAPNREKRHKGLSAFLVERGTEGFHAASKIETIGLRGSQPSELVLDHVKVPKDNLLGNEGDGFYVGVKTYDRGRIDVAAQGVGICQAAYEAAISYAQTRISFETPLIEFQQVQYKLAEMAMGLHTARLLTYWAASLKDQGKDFVKASSIAKVTSTEAAEKLSLLAMMIHGGYGVATEYPVERFLRDSQILKTYEGTNDIQRLTIAKQLLRELKS